MRLLSLDEAKEVAADLDMVEAATGIPYADWRGRCHEMSYNLLATGLFGPGRIARGVADGVPGQHSWLVLGPDVYDPKAVIVDPTYHHWTHQPEKGILVARAGDVTHTPHGTGSIWEWGQPTSFGGEVIELTPSKPLSRRAKHFLCLLGPLDLRGWALLAHAPVGGDVWPAAEIITAMYDTPELRAYIPIDIVGHLTDRNPMGVYLVEGLEPWEVATNA